MMRIPVMSERRSHLDKSDVTRPLRLCKEPEREVEARHAKAAGLARTWRDTWRTHNIRRGEARRELEALEARVPGA
jgi:hypothetical protein